MTVKAKWEQLERYGFGPNVMKRTRVCPSCGRMVTNTCSSCPDCGMRLMKKTLWDRYRERHMCCDRCGTVLAVDSRYCPPLRKSTLREKGSSLRKEKQCVTNRRTI